MQHTEKCVSKIKPAYAFLLCLAIIVCTVLISRVIPLEKYRFFLQLFVLLFVGGLIYLLYRYTMTVHIYILDETTFSVLRGEGIRQKTVAVLTGEMIRLICKASYEGERLPKGDFVTVNACSSLRGKNTGWCIWCVVDAHEKYKLVFEPSEELVQKLCAAFPEQSVPESSAQPSSPAE